jgi:hypothetical protein
MLDGIRDDGDRSRNASNTVMQNRVILRDSNVPNGFRNSVKGFFEYGA